MAPKPRALQGIEYAGITIVTFFWFLLLHATPQVSALTRIQRPAFSYGSFKKSDSDHLEVLKDASINGGALQLTPDTRNNVPFLQNKSGRVLHRQAYRLWDEVGNSTRVASFNTTFVVNIFRDSNVSIVADGLAFIIAPNLSPPPAGSEGEYLGLTNFTTDGETSNHLVAIELDTFKQHFDPDDNHIGLDVNSVRSVAEASLNSAGVVLSPVNATNHTVWINYNGSSRRILVYIANEGDPKPQSPVLDQKLDLSEHLLKDSFFGFSGSTGDHYQLNCVLSWNLTVEPIPVHRNHRMRKLVPYLAAATSFLVAVAIAVAWAMHRFRRRKMGLISDESRLGDKLKSLPGMAREFTYHELKKATENFHEKNLLGRGGFGVVYKAKIEYDPEIGGDVAVKISHETNKIDDFLMELTMINRLRHRNLLRLFGWCSENGKLLLVYEYMPMGSLDRHLYSDAPESILSWGRRCNILDGVTAALHYLHNEYDQKVVHRDLKSSNILLDTQFNARLGDFGLARAIESSQTSYLLGESGLYGTPGYMPPEYLHNMKATPEYDVFGFGAIILEVVSGRRPLTQMPPFKNLVNWVWFLHGKGRILEAVDEKLNGAYDAAEAERWLLLGLACSHPVSKERPKMEAIRQMIAGSVPIPHVPPCRPNFVYSGTSDNEDDADNLKAAAAVVFGDGDHRSYSSGSSSTIFDRD